MSIAAIRSYPMSCVEPCGLGGGECGAGRCRETRHLQRVARGAYLFDQGADCLSAYSVLSGALVLEYVDDNGGVAILRLVRPGELLGCADLFDGHEHRTSARAVAETVVCPLPEADLLAAMAAGGGFSLGLMRAAASESHAFSNFAQRQASLSVEARVLSLLEDLSGGCRRFPLPVSKKDLAFMAGTGPEVLSRTLVKLQKAGAIWMEGGEVLLTGSAEGLGAVRLAS